MEPTGALAAFVAETTYSALPEPVLHQSKRGWLDWLGIAVGGSHEPSVKMLLDVARSLGNRGPATVLGHSGLRLDPVWASLVNGHASHVLDFDDTMLSPTTLIHATAPVLPAVLALGESRHLDGKLALLATNIGIDVATRTTLAFGQSHINRGFVCSGTAGTIGSAAASAVMLGLDAERTAWALGLAGTQASGMQAVFGTEAKSYQVGSAASKGLLAALLAERGFDSGANIYESPRGLAAAMTEHLDVEPLVSALGQSWGVSTLGFKPYPCGVGSLTQSSTPCSPSEPRGSRPRRWSASTWKSTST